jgi:hypothetical protein
MYFWTSFIYYLVKVGALLSKMQLKLAFEMVSSAAAAAGSAEEWTLTASSERIYSTCFEVLRVERGWLR